MKKNNQTVPSNGVLTDRMDIGSDGFKEVQAILLNKSKERSSEQKREIELLALRFKMEDYLDSKDQNMKLPGEFLKQYLKTLEISQRQFAEYIHLRPSNLSKLISGERPISYELALIFGKIFNHDPMLWIKIQAKNELARIRQITNKRYHQYSINGLLTGR